jgi:uncharacterized OsmC-like protein/pimeloyl-ACP methyl ester carboxylesterase
MRTEKIEFMGHSGHLLAARLDRPDASQPAAGCVLLAHCFTCSKDIPAVRRLSQRLSALGFAVLRFDFTGLGHSQGEFENTHFTSNVRDLVLASEHLASMGLAANVLIGHSLGGAAVLAAAKHIDSAKAVVTVGAPFDPSHVAHHFAEHIEAIKANGSAQVDLGGRPFTITRDFLDDIGGARLDADIAGLRKALLVLHSPVDTTVGIDNAAQIFQAAKHPKSFVTLDHADHMLSQPADAEYAAQVIAAWVMHYVSAPAPAQHNNAAPEGTTRVVELDPQGFKQDVFAGPKHHLLADEPISAGGTDMGLTPYQLLAAGLGACTSMTIRMYARRKGWPLEHVSVDVTHAKVHAQDCAGCPDTGHSKIDEFTRLIRLTGTLSPEQHATLIAIADKCPVHRTLEATAHIVTTTA